MTLIQLFLLLDLIVFILQVVYFDVNFLAHSKEIVDLDLHHFNVLIVEVVLLNFLLVLFFELLEALVVVILLFPDIPQFILSFFHFFFEILNLT